MTLGDAPMMILKLSGFLFTRLACTFIDFILFSIYSKGPPTTPSQPLRSYFIILENVLGVNPPRYIGMPGF